MRPGDPPTLDNAGEYLCEQLYDARRYDLARVGRYKINKRLNLEDNRAAGESYDYPVRHRSTGRRMILINNGQEETR